MSWCFSLYVLVHDVSESSYFTSRVMSNGHVGEQFRSHREMRLFNNIRDCLEKSPTRFPHFIKAHPLFFPGISKSLSAGNHFAISCLILHLIPT